MIDPFEAVQKIKDTGYDTLEICLREGWPTSPEVFDVDQQRKLAKLSESLGFESPIFFGAINVCALEDEQEAMLEDAADKFRFARELHYDDTPTLVTTTPGRIVGDWESGKEVVRDAFLRLADLAVEHDVIIAIEAHAGTVFEFPEKAKEIFYEILDQEQENEIPKDVYEKAKNEFDRRYKEIEWNKYHNSLPFNTSALALYEWSPIAEELKTLDRKIVLNSMILKWDNIKKEFEELINF